MRRTTVVAGVAEVLDAEGARGAAPLVALAAGRADVHIGSLASGGLPSAMLRSPRGLARPAYDRVSRLYYRLEQPMGGRCYVHLSNISLSRSPQCPAAWGPSIQVLTPKGRLGEPQDYSCHFGG